MTVFFEESWSIKGQSGTVPESADQGSSSGSRLPPCSDAGPSQHNRGMEGPAAAHIDQAVTASLTVLSPATDADWQLLAGDLEWTCGQTAAHIAHDLLAYTS